MRIVWVVVLAAACAQHPHPDQVPGPAPRPPLPGAHADEPTMLAIDAAPPPIALSFAPTPWARGDRFRVEVDEGDAKDVTAVVIDDAEPLAIVAMIDKRSPDAEHAVGTSCAASLGENGPAAAGTSVACTLAVHRLAALVDLVAVAKAPRGAGDHADGLARVPLDLIGASPGKATAVVEAVLDRGRAVLAVTADGTRDGRPVHLHGRIMVDHTLTAASGELHGTDGERTIAVFFDLGPAD